MSQYLNIGIIRISSYGLFMTVGVFLCAYIIFLRAKNKGIKSEEIIIVMATTIGSALFGAGILYTFISYSIKELLSLVLNGNFTVFLNGGLVFYGGLIGGILGALISTKIQNLNETIVETSIVPILPLGHAIGRVGCLFAGCCHGFEYDGIFAVKNLLLSQEKTYFPIQLVESGINIVIMLFLLRYSRKNHKPYNILCVYLILYSICRFVLEFFRGDLIRGVFFMLSTSQWISILIFCAAYLFCKLKNGIVKV